MDVDVLLVPVTELDVFWPEAGALLEGALEYTMGETDLDNLYELIREGSYLLAVVVDHTDDMLLAAFIVEHCVFAKKSCLKLAFAGAVPNTAPRWIEPMWDFMLEGAAAFKVDFLEIIGRPGWEKLLPEEQGWTKQNVILTRSL